MQTILVFVVWLASVVLLITTKPAEEARRNWTNDSGVFTYIPMSKQKHFQLSQSARNNNNRRNNNNTNASKLNMLYNLKILAAGKVVTKQWNINFWTKFKNSAKAKTSWNWMGGCGTTAGWKTSPYVHLLLGGKPQASCTPRSDLLGWVRKSKFF